MKITPKELANMIDHSQLHADSTREDIIKLANEASEYHFKGVCVNPFWVSVARDNLVGKKIELVSVIGFPLGQNKTMTKVNEAKQAIEDGATEIDMVMNIGALKSQMFEYVENDIRELANLGVTLKVIIETCYLFHEEKIMACEMAKRAGASYIKTSTGFGPFGATRKDIELIRKVVGNDMGIKAAGGISSWQKALEMVETGADRIGASKSIQIIEDYRKNQ